MKRRRLRSSDKTEAGKHLPESFSEESVRTRNPELDIQFGPAAVVRWQRQGGKRASEANDTDVGAWQTAWDQLADRCCETASANKNHRKNEKRRTEIRQQQEDSQEVTLSLSPDVRPASRVLFFLCGNAVPAPLLWGAVRAGFFLFAVDSGSSSSEESDASSAQGSLDDADDANASSRGLLALELGGRRRQRWGSQDHGGRVVLEDLKSLVPSKRALKTVCAPGTAREHAHELFEYRFVATTDTSRVLAALITRHGVDWVGFDSVRRAYDQLHASPAIQVVAFELWGRPEGSPEPPTLASAEFGLVVGACYTCVSLFSATETFPRCNQLRVAATVSWLDQRGVRLVDAGVSADYFLSLGFAKTTRAEFLALWRTHRDATLSGPSSMEGSCDNILELLLPAAGSGSAAGPVGDPGANQPITSKTEKPSVRLTWAAPCPLATEESVKTALESAFGAVARVALKRNGKGETFLAFAVFGAPAAADGALAAGALALHGRNVALSQAPGKKRQHGAKI
jgi:Leu/Phe-tRNA-protein transferase